MERTGERGAYSSFRWKNIFSQIWNKQRRARFTLVEVSEQHTFDNLALPLLDQLYNFAHWLTQDRTEAEDLVQETYAKALRGFDLFRPGTNFRAWMYKILRNTFLTSRTGMRAAMDQFDEDKADTILPPVTTTPETLLVDKTNRELLQQALGELPVTFREVVLLADVEEMSYQEIAETLAIPPGTVMSRLSRARAALRQLVRKKLEGAA
jgi:RNA polymerase sigma-70 factor (ECF subfamily)